MKAIISVPVLASLLLGLAGPATPGAEASLLFDGLSSRAALDGPFLNGGEHSQYTLEAWVKPAGLGGTIVKKTQTWKEWWLRLTPAGGLALGGAWPSTYWGDTEVGTGSIVTDTWQHVCCCVSDGLATFYVNGSPVGTAEAHDPIDFSVTPCGSQSASISIGYAVNCTVADGDFFSGSIYGIRIWSRCLPANEVNAIAMTGVPASTAELVNAVMLDEGSGTTIHDSLTALTGRVLGAQWSSDTPMFPPDSFLTRGLVAYYPFNGNADDESPNANNGTPVNAVLAVDRFGVAGKAYQFNGVNAYISAPNRSYLTFADGGDFTVSLWAAFSALPTTWPNGFQSFIALDNGPGAQPKWMFAYGELALPDSPGYGGRHYVHFHTSGSTGAEGYWLGCKAYTPTLSVWHNYLVTKAGTTYTLYIDGIEATRATNYFVSSGGAQQAGVTGPSAIISGITAPLTIGHAEGGGAFFAGELDDVRIYSRALPAIEVQELYTIESGPRLDLIKAVKPAFSNLTIGTRYQLQSSPDIGTWTDVGTPFTATEATVVYPEYWEVENWNSLYFRLRIVP